MTQYAARDDVQLVGIYGDGYPPVYNCAERARQIVGQSTTELPAYQNMFRSFHMPVYRKDLQNRTHVVGIDPVTYWVLLATIVAGGVVIYTWRKLTPTQQSAFLKQ